MKRVSIVGLGYIGLPTAILAAEEGYKISGYDVDAKKVQHINSGTISIYEPEIQKRLLAVLQNKSFKAGTTLEYADCYIITVPTPLLQNKNANLSYVWQAGEAIAKCLMPGNLIIIESTIPVGTTAQLGAYIEDISGLKLSHDFYLAHCPERCLPGKIFKELKENDRIIGGLCQKSSNLAYQFYKKFVKGFLFCTDDQSAELVKLIENSSRDVQIAFANQVASICQSIGIDPYRVIELANKHPRVNILSPTCGAGGHCIPIDPWFLIEKFPENTDLIKKAREINNKKPLSIIDHITLKTQEFNSVHDRKPNILGLGLTFKPNVDDIRESPALYISQAIAKKTNILTFSAYDPYITDAQKRTIPFPLVLTTSLQKSLSTADIIVILVKHKQFFALVEKDFCHKMVIDTCGLLYDVEKKYNKQLLGGLQSKHCYFENISL